MMKVELSLHATKLPNVAGILKGTSDPFAVVTHLPSEPGVNPTVIGKTEVIKNTLYPKWAKVFVFDYELGTPMPFVVDIYDEVRKGENKKMGSAVFQIGTILGRKGNTQAKKMKNGAAVYAHVAKHVGVGTLRLQMTGEKLKNVEGFMKKSDPLYEILKKQEGPAGMSWDVVYRSKPVMDNLSPTWSDAVIDLGILCSGDLDKELKISVYDYEKSGRHVPMGEFETSVNGLISAKATGSFTMMKKGKKTGTVYVKKAVTTGLDEGLNKQMEAATISSAPKAAFVPSSAPSAFVPPTVSASSPTFVDYISGGCEMNLCVAIDFTGSNGDPRKPGTLHHFNSDGSKNDYEKAVSAIGSILAKYDSDKKFPVWGFGAKYGGIVRHCFQCGPASEVDGVEGILSAYRGVFATGLIMSGPTVFTEVIQTAAAHAISLEDSARQKGGQSYTTLLILTDGSVSDVNATADALRQVSDAPLSVVIVGIGRADFSGMRFLDDFETSSKRDIAQFVEFNAHKHSSQSLTSATLQEIPDQLVKCFTSKGIMPSSPIQMDDEEIAVEPYIPEEEIDLSLNFGGEDEEIVVSGGGAYVPGNGF